MDFARFESQALARPPNVEMRFVLELTDVDMQEAYRMPLMISFVQRLKGWIEGVDGGELWACLSFIVMLESGAMHGAK